MFSFYLQTFLQGKFLKIIFSYFEEDNKSFQMILNLNKYILGKYQIIYLENGVSIVINVCFGKNEDF